MIFYRSIYRRIRSELSYAKALLVRQDEEQAIFGVLDPSVYSLNVGDHVISDACRRHLVGIFSDHQIIVGSTHQKMSLKSASYIARSEIIFVAGSNILSDFAEFDSQWPISVAMLGLRQKLVLMGVGLRGESIVQSPITRLIFKRLLSRNHLHSVRDSRTEAFVRSLGINNVINTSCPTMWDLDAAFCDGIPERKANSCVFTLTDYLPSDSADVSLIGLLKNKYDKIYFWPQGSRDLAYLKTLGNTSGIEILPPSLEIFDQLCLSEEIDYVGTRLHGGVRAMQHGVRAIILSVDNRARQIGLDIGLKTVARADIDQIGQLIDGGWSVDLRLPEGDIARWKRQFEPSGSLGAVEDGVKGTSVKRHG